MSDSAASMNVQEAQKAVMVATQYPGKIHSAALAAQAVALGPWVLHVSCKYGTSDKASASYNTNVDFGALRAQLQGTLRSAEQQATQFLTTFNFVKTWLAQTLPRISGQFTAAAQAEAAAMSALRQRGSITPAERSKLINSLNTLIASLQTSSDELTKGVQGLSSFALSQQNYGQQILAVVQRVTAAAQKELQNIQAQIKTQPCGQGDGTRQLMNFILQFTNASVRFQNIFANLSNDTKAANDAVSLLMGTVLNFINKYRPVIKQIEQTQDSQLGGALQLLHLSIATSQWKDLASYAGSQLQVERQALTRNLAIELNRAGGVMMDSFSPVERAVESVFGTA